MEEGVFVKNCNGQQYLERMSLRVEFTERSNLSLAKGGIASSPPTAGAPRNDSIVQASVD